MKDLKDLNRKLFFKLYKFSSQNESCGKTAVALSKTAEIFFFAIYGIGALMILLSPLTAGKSFSFMILLRYLAVPLITLIYNTFLRKLLGRPRPFVREENVKSLTGHKESGSCPSNHAASSMVISMAWYCIFPPITLLLMIPVALTGISRVLTGEHYPFDVMLGWFIGFTAGILGFVMKF